MNEKYNIELQTTTPLHIGNGKSYSSLEYFIDKGHINFIDINSVFESIGKGKTEEESIKAIDELSKKIEKSVINTQQTIDAKAFFAEYVVNVSDFVIKTLQTDIKPQKRVEIHQFINQNGRYYIPGSSIKGAIRTAYLFNYFDKNENIEKLVRVLNDHQIYDKSKSNELNKIVFGEITDDFFKYIHVEDSQFLTDDNIKVIETRRYNNKPQTTRFNNKPQKETILIYLETIKENTLVNFEIKIHDRFNGKIEDMKNSIRNLTGIVCDYEIKNNKNPDFIRDFYDKILDSMKNPDEIYLNVGFGGGFLPKTIYLLLWKYKKEINLIKRLLPTRNDKRKGIYQRVDSFDDFPRTKTIYDDNPIGWVKLKF